MTPWKTFVDNLDKWSNLFANERIGGARAMEKVKSFKIETVPQHAIALATTLNWGYEEFRMLLVENWPEYSDLTIARAYHCSCYGFRDSEWEAITYTRDELKKLMPAWKEDGYSIERHAAPLLEEYLARDS